MPGYAYADVRQGLAGTADKLALIDGVATGNARSNRQLREFVLRLVAPAGSDAAAQVDRIEAYAERQPVYTREAGEVFGDPAATAKTGGDCDDLTLFVLSACRCLGIPCLPEAFRDPDRGAYHVRARVGLPVVSPPEDVSRWRIVDPVWKSERRWATAGAPSVLPVSSTPSRSSPWPLLFVFGAGVGVGWLLARRA